MRPNEFEAFRKIVLQASDPIVRLACVNQESVQIELNSMYREQPIGCATERMALATSFTNSAMRLNSSASASNSLGEATPPG
jgi:hypothetical protein